VHPPATRLDVERLLRERRVGHTLPGPCYVDPDVHRLDLERIWYREWIFVAHAADVPEPGSYVTVAVGDHRIVIVRGGDDRIRAMHNVCRHRGSLVCTETAGTARRRLVCPYHQWSYELDGTLARARAAGDVDAAVLGLGPVACEVVADSMIFVSLADDPPDFSPMRTLADGYLAPFRLGTARVAARSVTIEQANWKLVMENNRECHHCRASHPELCVSFPEEPLHTGGASDADARALENVVRRGVAHGLPSDYIASPDHQFRAMRMPLKGETRSMTIDGTPAVKRRFGDLPDENLGDVLLYHYPTTWNHFMADHAVTFRILPLGPSRTQLTTTWLVPADAEPGVDYDVDDLTHVWTITNAQDTELVERTQLGVQSPAYRPGPYAPIDELGVTQFVDWYVERMSAEPVPNG
jgi:Rieske 2Fe-2S family protein